MAVRLAVLVLCLAGTALASRHLHQLKAQASGGNTCTIAEKEGANGYGIHASFKVQGNCKNECLFNRFVSEILPNNVIHEPQLSDSGDNCKCYTVPRFFENNGFGKEFWFQYRVSRNRKCTKENCRFVFETWANMYLKKLHSPNERLDTREMALSQKHFEPKGTCDDSEPTGVVLPSPAGKVAELRLQIAKCKKDTLETGQPGDEKCKELQDLLDELLGDKDVEVFAYVLEGDWGPEHTADAGSTVGDGELHSFKLKPCESNHGTVISALHEIFEICGEAVVGESLLPVRQKMHFDKDGPWGGELTCSTAVDLGLHPFCKTLQEAAADHGELLSFRLKRCATSSCEKGDASCEVTDLGMIIAACGGDNGDDVVVGKTLLPVKVSIAVKLANDLGLDTSPENFPVKDDLPFPCEEAVAE